MSVRLQSLLPRRKAAYIICAICVAFIISKRPPYIGDGRFIDNGLIRLGYRYEVKFEPFVVKEEVVERTYLFSGVSPQEYALELEMFPDVGNGETSTFANFEPIYEELRDRGVHVELSLYSNKRRTVHIENSPLLRSSKALPSGSWVLSSWRFFNQDFSDVPFSRQSTYELRIVVKPEEPLLRPRTFRVNLLGGYNNVF